MRWNLITDVWNVATALRRALMGFCLCSSGCQLWSGCPAPRSNLWGCGQQTHLTPLSRKRRVWPIKYTHGTVLIFSGYSWFNFKINGPWEMYQCFQIRKSGGNAYGLRVCNMTVQINKNKKYCIISKHFVASDILSIFWGIALNWMPTPSLVTYMLSPYCYHQTKTKAQQNTKNAHGFL